MNVLSLSPISISLHHHQHSPFSKPISSSTPSSSSSSTLSSSTLSCSPVSPKSFTACNSKNRGNPLDESSFLDEDGVVEDMDGYLNHLSLEYESVWDTKPSWCQPWTILLTGVTVVTCSWLFLHSTIISAGVLFIVSVWWYIFLYAYPKAFSDMIAERREKVTSGVEDTFGIGKGQ